MTSPEIAARAQKAAADRTKINQVINEVADQRAQLAASAAADQTARTKLAYQAVADPEGEAAKQLQALTTRAIERKAREGALDDAEAHAKKILAVVDRQTEALHHLVDAEAHDAKTAAQRLVMEKAGDAAATLAEALRILRTDGGLNLEGLKQVLAIGGLSAELIELGVNAPAQSPRETGTWNVDAALRLFETLVEEPRRQRTAYLRATADDPNNESGRVRIIGFAHR